MRIPGAWRVSHALATAKDVFGELRSRWSWSRRLSVPALRATRVRSDADVRRDLERLLHDNILPFWITQTIDQHGGFRQNHDTNGIWLGASSKHIVGQARETWFFAKLARTAYGTRAHLEVARHGFDYLRDRMWDDEHGGFFWEVSADGRRPTQPGKHLYGQAFGLYAISEYALASGDKSAGEMACAFFDLLERRAHDSERGGYSEFFERNWSRPTAGTRDYRNGLEPTTKTFDTHLHLLEALTSYCRLSGAPLVRQRLGELAIVLMSTTSRRVVGPAIDRHTADWTPVPGRPFHRVNYGHDVENAWLLVEAFGELGWPAPLLANFSESTMAHTLAYGFDPRYGGLFLQGYAGVPADRREKLWWVQAEALVATLLMAQKDPAYRLYFDRILDWVLERQVDWAHGDWHAVVDERGRPSGRKAEPFKTPYHNGRAVLRCLELIGSSSSTAESGTTSQPTRIEGP
jgi:cellobiose epimerase